MNHTISSDATAAAHPSSQMLFTTFELKWRGALRLQGDNKDVIAVSMVTSWHTAAPLTAV